MPNLKLLSLVVLAWVGISLPLQAEQDFDLSAGKFGLSFPLCSGKKYEESSHDYPTLYPCRGFGLSYVEKSTNLVLSFAYINASFTAEDDKENFVRQYTSTNLRLGYKINFDTWIRKFWDRDIFILSSLYLAIYPLELYRSDTFTTRDYQFKRNSYFGPYFTGEDLDFPLELGWKINEQWDVFTSTEKTQLGPFLFPKKGALVRTRVNVMVSLLGFHYSFK